MAYKVFLGLDLTQALSWLTVTSGYDVIIFQVKDCGLQCLANTY